MNELSILNQIKHHSKSLLEQGYYATSNKPLPTDVPLFSDLLNQKFSIIAELKVQSPTSPNLLNRSIRDQLDLLAKEADGFSVLTEPEFFKGRLEYLDNAVEYNRPVLMKDFIFDTQQIYAGIRASAFLLLMKLINLDTIREFQQLISQINREAIVEVDNEQDFIRLLDENVDIIGINNRNLDTFNMDYTFADRLVTEYDPETPIIGLSGYSSVEAIQRSYESGIAGVVIGSHLSRTAHPDQFLRLLKTQLGGGDSIAR